MAAVEVSDREVGDANIGSYDSTTSVGEIEVLVDRRERGAGDCRIVGAGGKVSADDREGGDGGSRAFGRNRKWKRERTLSILF